MVGSTGLGMACAVMSGLMNAFGAILQKGAVDRTETEQHGGRLMAHLFRSPPWLLGFFLTMGLGTVFVLAAQSLIGPALMPGLTASGLIVLAIGSAKLLGERLSRSEIAGVVVGVAGIACLGLAGLEISSNEVSLLEGGFAARLMYFTFALVALWLLTFWLALQSSGQSRGLILSFSSGFLYALSNLWTLPMLLTIGPVFAGRSQPGQVLIFVVACVLLVGTNAAGIRQVAESYRFAAANKAMPIQQIPIQIVPIATFFFVFQRLVSTPKLLLIPLAVGMIVASGFLLGQRSAQVQEDVRANQSDGARSSA